MDIVGVIGCGTMGNGIAHSFAIAGYKVYLIDLDSSRLDKAIQLIDKNLGRQLKKDLITTEEKTAALERIHCSREISQIPLSASLIVEAIIEDKSAKQSLFDTLDQHFPESTILASNTSSISISSISSGCEHKSRVIGLHFMNPVPVMQLVEVIKTKNTSEAVLKKSLQHIKNLKKTPVPANDSPGFVSNRILMPMINEAILALEEQIANAEEIDSIMKLGMAHPMGPLELADYIGLDVCLNIMDVLSEGFNSDKYTPAPLLRQMVANKQLGRKSGKGFYQY